MPAVRRKHLRDPSLMHLLLIAGVAMNDTFFSVHRGKLDKPDLRFGKLRGPLLENY